jgi:hypothetical protein
LLIVQVVLAFIQAGVVLRLHRIVIIIRIGWISAYCGANSATLEDPFAISWEMVIWLALLERFLESRVPTLLESLFETVILMGHSPPRISWMLTILVMDLRRVRVFLFIIITLPFV